MLAYVDMPSPGDCIASVLPIDAVHVQGHQAIYSLGLITLLCIICIFPQGVRAPERPIVPNVTATSPTEIKMSWCRVKSNKIEIDHYELFIDNELEYSGIDVMYVAKRLKPWTWYEVKLRACGFQPSFKCSPFSRPILVKTLSSNDNNTAIKSTASMFKAVVVPTYMFIAGVLVGVVILAMGLIWRYLQSNDSWMNEPAFELPTHVQPHARTCLKGKIAKLNLFLTEPESEKENLYHQTTETEEYRATEEGAQPSTEGSQDDHIDSRKQEMSVKTGDACFLINDSQSVQHSGIEDNPSEHSELSSCSPHIITQTQDVCPGNSFPDDQQNYQINTLGEDISKSWCSEVDIVLSDNQETQCALQQLDRIKDGLKKSCHLKDRCTTSSHENKSEPLINLPQVEHEANTRDTKITSFNETSNETSAVIVIDNSNIYIGAQECASTNNVGDRKRHVRVKLQNLVKILEKNRAKERTFVCGSSPPATEHVWDVYRHLGYVVDLEERRGKDEQRVDEGLHLFIYKAICELSPRVLVLASGDGMKGKSENSTSFPGCATMALEKGWRVEVHSWKHSLSAEWHKLAKKYPHHLTINFLDKYVNQITFVDGRNGRKCLPVTGTHERSFESRPSGRISYHNG